MKAPVRFFVGTFCGGAIIFRHLFLMDYAQRNTSGGFHEVTDVLVRGQDFIKIFVEAFGKEGIEVIYILSSFGVQFVSDSELDLFPAESSVSEDGNEGCAERMESPILRGDGSLVFVEMPVVKIIFERFEPRV